MNVPQLLSSEASKSALEATSDISLRVPCYCEENVWRLAYRRIFQQQSGSTYHVAFVSNPKACVPMFEQLAAEDRDQAVMWDYHVLLLMTMTALEYSKSPKTYVLDIDSHLPYPCPLEKYIEIVFPNHMEWDKEFLPYFRVIDASVYLRHFSSDRSHMYNAKTKTWNAPPPSYNCISEVDDNDKPNSESERTTNTANTLKQYMTISAENVFDSQKQKIGDSPYGQIYSLSQLRQHFGLQIEEHHKKVM